MKQVDKIALEFLEIKRQQKELENRLKALKDKIKDIADKDGMEVVSGDKFYFTYTQVNKQIVDNDKLKLDGLYNKYLKETEYMQLSPPKAY